MIKHPLCTILGILYLHELTTVTLTQSVALLAQSSQLGYCKVTTVLHFNDPNYITHHLEL